MIRLRSVHLRAARYGGQVAASAGRAVRFVVTTVVFAGAGGGARLLACPMCFGAEETTMVEGTKLGILVMLGIIVAVQAAFVGFFLYLRRQAKRAAEIEIDSEWSELQRSPRTT